jgi:pyruvate dehydrogenase E2 component (dihydrolipoamide acetyltransferase)
VITEIVMPDVGHAEPRATVIRWLVQEGDQLEVGTLLVEVETDKAVLTIEAFRSGFLRKILITDGETADTGAIIALMSDSLDEPLPDLTEKAEPVIPEVPAGPESSQSERGQAPDRGSVAREVQALPAARRLASKAGIDLSSITGSGHGGVITQEDVRQALASLTTVASDAKGRLPLSPRRRLIAERMAESKQNIPHFYMSVEIDMTEAERLRKRLNLDGGATVPISPGDLVLRAVAIALEDFRMLNATYLDGELLTSAQVNLGIAVDTEEGVVVPVLRMANTKSLYQIAQDRAKLAQGAREGGLTSSQLSGATFTVSNLGMHGVESFAAIINPPEVGILAVGSIVQQPAVVGDQIAICSVMKATLSVDHRVVDGVFAARFLGCVRDLLENPGLLQKDNR